MEYATSADGTKIAFDRSGTGPPVVVIAPALADHADAKRLARHLAERFTVFNYDRRGRGESGRPGRPDVDREVEDVAAVIDSAGGSASLFGSSSGAILALDAAQMLGDRVNRIALFEPPFIVDDTRAPVTPGDIRRIEQHLAAGREGDAVRDFMTLLGMPSAMVTVMRLLPTWRKLKKLAPTLPYDLKVLEGTQSGTALPRDRWSGVVAPTLVITGEKSDAFFHTGARALIDVLPEANHIKLPKATHSAVVAAPKRLGEVIANFLGRETT